MNTNNLDSESRFLHELASPLMIAILHCQALKEDAQTQATAEGQKRIPKMEKALLDIKNLLEARRQSLKTSP